MRQASEYYTLLIDPARRAVVAAGARAQGRPDPPGVHSRGSVNWCQPNAGSGGSQGLPAMAVLMASSAATDPIPGQLDGRLLQPRDSAVTSGMTSAFARHPRRAGGGRWLTQG